MKGMGNNSSFLFRSNRTKNQCVPLHRGLATMAMGRVTCDQIAYADLVFKSQILTSRFSKRLQR